MKGRYPMPLPEPPRPPVSFGAAGAVDELLAVRLRWVTLHLQKLAERLAAL